MYNDLLSDIEKDVSGDWKKIQKRMFDKKKNEKNMKYGQFFSLLDGIIELNKKNRNRDLINVMGVNYFIEFCTIKFDIGRQTGKTEYIIKNAKKDDLIIVLNSKLLYDMREKVECDVVIFQDVINGYIPRIRSEIYDTIWVDNFSYISKYEDKVDYIFNVFCDRRIEQTFVFLG